MKAALRLAALLVACGLAPLAAADPSPGDADVLCIDSSGDCLVHVYCIVDPCHPIVVCVAGRVCAPQDPSPVPLLP